MAYSIEIRKKILEAVDSGNWKKSQIAEMYSVSTRWINWLLKQRKETGSIDTRYSNGGRKSVFDESGLKKLVELIENQPDLTLNDLVEKTGHVCSYVTIHNTLKKLGYRLKKNSKGK